jgi:hypothetical protein
VSATADVVTTLRDAHPLARPAIGHAPGFGLALEARGQTRRASLC